MIRSVLLPMVTKSPNRVRFASDAGMHAQANFTAMQRAIVGLVLRDLFTPPDRLLFTHPVQTGLVPNRITVTFSRLSRGTLDGWENLRSAFKGCKDEVAAWCGIDDKEGAGITWADPLQLPGKAKHPAIRIVIEDLTPCDDRAVELNDRQMAEYTARAKLKVKADKAARDLAKLLRPKEAKVSRNRGRKAGEREERAEGRKLFERASAKKGHAQDCIAKATSGKVACNCATEQDPAKRGRMRANAAPPLRTPEDVARGYRERTPSPAGWDAAALKASGQADPVMLAACELARSVACPVPLCAAPAATPAGPIVAWGCANVPGEPFAYGAHLARARLADLPPFPSAAELDAGAKLVREEQACGDCKGDGSGAWGLEQCDTCKGSGKVTRFVWRAKDPAAAEAARKLHEARVAEIRAAHAEGRPERDSGPAADFAVLGPDGSEDGTPRTEADCPRAACMAKAPAPCIVLEGDKLVHGVHPERARAAGVVGVSAPPRRKTGAQGPRKLAAKVEIEAWLSCPWWPKCRPCGGTGFGEAPPGAYPVVPCPTCHGTGLKLARIPALDGEDPPREQIFTVPLEHQRAHGSLMVLVRREWSRAGKVCWLYRPA